MLLPRQHMRRLRRVWRDQRGLEMVETVAIVGVTVALLVAVLTVFAGRGNTFGSAGVETLVRFINGGSATSANPATPVAFQTASTQAVLTAPSVAVPTVVAQSRGLGNAAALTAAVLGTIGLLAAGRVTAQTSAGPATTASAAPKGDTPWWESAWNWVVGQWNDAKEIFSDPGMWIGIGVGVALTVGAIALGVLGAPVWVGLLVVVGIGATAAAVGTIASNLFAGRPWHTSLLQNTLLGAGLGLVSAVAASFGAVGLIGAGIVAGLGSIVANVLTGQRWDKGLLANIVLAIGIAWVGGKILPHEQAPNPNRPGEVVADAPDGQSGRTNPGDPDPDGQNGRRGGVPCVGWEPATRVRGLASVMAADPCDPKQQKLEQLKKQRAAKARLDKLNEKMKQWDAKGRYDKLTPDEKAWIEADPTGRRKQLAFDPDKDQYKVNEAKAAELAEKAGVPGPVERDINPSDGKSNGGDYMDANGELWDVKDAIREGSDKVVETASPPRPGKPGENVIVDCSQLTADQKRALIADVNKRLPPGSGKVVFVGGPDVSP